MLSLEHLRPYTFTITGFNGVPAAMVDELIACQHPTDNYRSSVKMEADYVFDASVDDSISIELRDFLKQIQKEYPDTGEFEFNC